MPRTDTRQTLPLASSGQNTSTQDASTALRSSTPTMSATVDGLMNSQYLGHPTNLRPQTDSRASLNSPTTVTNQNIIQMNSEQNPHQSSSPSSGQTSSIEATAMSFRHRFAGEALLDNNAFSSSTLASSPNRYTLPYTIPELDTDNTDLTNMSLEEINALQQLLSSQLTDLETSIRDVRSRMRSTSTSNRQKQERRPSLGARAA